MIKSIEINDRCFFRLEDQCKDRTVIGTLRWIFLVLISNGFINANTPPGEYDVNEYVLDELRNKGIIFIKIMFLDGTCIDFSISTPFYRIEHCISIKNENIISKPAIDLLYCRLLSNLHYWELNGSNGTTYLPINPLTQDLLDFINNGTKDYEPFKDTTLIGEDKVIIYKDETPFYLSLAGMGSGYNRTISFFMACYELLSCGNSTYKILLLNEPFDLGLDSSLRRLLIKKSKEMGINLIDVVW